MYATDNGSFVGEGDLYRSLDGKPYPGVPDALLNVMFTSWAKYGYVDKSSLPKFYAFVDEYLEIANEHFPVNIIPK